MQYKDEKVCYGNLDFDNDPRYVKAGDYLDIRNFRGSRTDSGKDGTVENVKTLVEATDLQDINGASISLPNGINKCIGTYTSTATRRSFIFVWNSEEEHTIWQYDHQTKIYKRLFIDQNWGSALWSNASVLYNEGDVVRITTGGQAYVCVVSHSSNAIYNVSPETNSYLWKEVDNYLNFREFQLIYDVVELNRDGDTLLIWTDGENEVKYINVDRAQRTSGDTYPTTLESEYFDLIPTTPQLGIPIYDEVVQVAANADIDIALDEITITSHGLATGTPVVYTATKGNIIPLVRGTIYYVINTGANTFKLATTEANAIGGTNIVFTSKPFLQFASFTTQGTARSSDSETEPNNLIGKYYQFRYQYEYADGMISPWSPVSKIVTTPSSIKLRRGYYDFFRLKIPRRDGLDNSYCKRVNVAVREVGSGNVGDWYLCKTIDATDKDQSEDDRVSTLDNYVASQLGMTTATINVGSDQNLYWYEFDFYGDEPKLTIPTDQVNELYSYLPKNVRSMCLVGDNRLLVGNTTEGYDLNITDYFDGKVISQTPTFKASSTDASVPPKRTYKRGANHKYGIIYSDGKGRVSSVIPFNNEINVPWYDAAMASSKGGAYVQMELEFDMAPPEWAKYYQIVYSKNRTYIIEGSNERFVQMQIFDVKSLGTDGDGITKYRGNIKNFIDYFNLAYQNNNSAVKYDFVKGDLIRFVYDNTNNNYFGNTTSILEGVIESYDTGTGEVVWNGAVAPYSALALFGDKVDGDWVELMSANNIEAEDDQIFWYEIGETFRIVRDTSGNWTHSTTTDRPLVGSNINQSIGGTVDAKIYLSGGDCWHYTRDVNRLLGIPSTSVTPTPTNTLTLDSHNLYEGQYAIITYNSGFSATGISSGDLVRITAVTDSLFSISTTAAYPTVATINTAGDVNILSFESFNVESPYIEDFVESKSTDIGRPTIVSEDDLQEKHREVTTRISQPFIPDTDINNIGFFYGNDFSEFNRNYGSIQKLHTTSAYVSLYQETKFGRIPIQRSQIEDLEGQGLVGILADLIGRIQYSDEEYGIGLNGESHIAYGGFEWWCDPNRNAVLQSTSGSFNVISNNNTKFYFDQIFQTIKPYTNKIKLIGGYDKEFDEYLLTFDVRLQVDNLTGQIYSPDLFEFEIPNANDDSAWFNGFERGYVDALLNPIGINGLRAGFRYLDNSDNYMKEVFGIPSDISIGQRSIEDIGSGLNITLGSARNTVYGFFRDCIAFSPKSQGWSSRYDFECDWFAEHGNKLATIKDGILWRHNDIELLPETYGNFYGTQYEASVTLPFNQDPMNRKQWLAVEIESNDGNWYIPEMENNRGQQSRLPNNFFKEREGEFYAPILRDTTTPNRINVLLEGYKMVGSYLKVKFNNTSTSLVNLFSSTINYMNSKYR